MSIAFLIHATGNALSWELAAHDEKVQCLELLGSFPITPLIYVDDLVAEYASAPDACSAATVGLTTYATSFNWSTHQLLLASRRLASLLQ